MHKVLLCHRRHNDVGNRECFHHWLEERSQLVLDLQTDLGYLRYAQVHQLPRRNLLYRGIRVTRSWFVAAFLSSKTGSQLPPLAADPHTRREERWDVIDELSYESKEAFVAALTSDKGIAAAKRLVDDHATWSRRSVVVTNDELVVAADPQGKFPRISTVFCLRALPGMPREDMLDYWESSHQGLVVSLQRSLGYRAYDQLHVRSNAELEQAINHLGGNVGEEFDGVALLAYGSQWGLILGFLNPFAQIANLRLVKDEITFIDGQRSALVFGTEYRFK